MPRISVIVPVYKVEAYLDRCVRSILDQTFHDFELLLLDDESPDNSGAMCDQWAQKDQRIRVLHEQHQGLAGMRNVGLTAATGDTVVFIDSDDYVHPKMLELLIGTMDRLNADIVGCEYQLTQGEDLPPLPDDIPVRVWEPQRLYRERIVDAVIPCAKLYRKECFNGIRYPVGRTHEDEYVTYRILFSGIRIAFVEAKMYGYYQNPNSITLSGWKPQRLDVLDAMLQQASFFKERGYPELYRMRSVDYVKYLVQFIREIAKSADPAQYADIVRDLRKQGRRFLRKNRRSGFFKLGKDSWMIGYFYPRIVRMHSYVQILLRRHK